MSKAEPWPWLEYGALVALLYSPVELTRMILTYQRSWPPPGISQFVAELALIWIPVGLVLGLWLRRQT